jgi:hypothetical protein
MPRSDWRDGPTVKIKMQDLPTSSQSGNGRKKITMPEPVGYRNKAGGGGAVLHFLVWYRNQTMDAGTPVPALASSMPDAQLCLE